MQEKSLFEYAIIRVVPRVERDEFFNVGVALFCKKLGFLKVRFQLDRKKATAFLDEDMLMEIEEHLKAFKQIAEGRKNCGPIAALDPASRFRWLTAVRSTVIQTSRVHPGLCHHPEQELDKLFEMMVL